MPGQLIGDQDLVSIATSQPIWRQAPHLLEEAGICGIARCVQTGAIEAGTGVTVVGVFVDDLVPKLRLFLAQRLELGTDGATRLLRVGRDASIDGNGHCATSRDW